MKLPELTAEEKAIYKWQMWIDNFGEEGQRKLKGATALVSRCGGLGGPICYHLASAGIGGLVLAHGGNVKHSDLNRQILMTYDWLGKPRVESAARRIKDLNPLIKIEAVPENICENNVAKLVAKADIVFDCAPLFEERFLMNRESVRQGKPMIEAAMFGMEGSVTTIIPGKTACLACIYPEKPSQWKRQFPVLGAVSSLAAAIAAIEGIKLITGIGKSLAGSTQYFDSGSMQFLRLPAVRRPDCPVCGNLVSYGE